MIRTWGPDDLHLVARAMLELKMGATWANDLQYDQEELVKWLLSIYVDHRVMVFLDDNDGNISAVIGVLLDTFFLPPHPSLLNEWCMWGTDAKTVMKTWAVAKEWGRTHGALYAKRSIQDRHREHLKWEKLI